MTPERWQRLQELFHKVSQLPEANREALLLRECSSDSEMLEELRGMLNDRTDPAEKVGAELNDYHSELDTAVGSLWIVSRGPRGRGFTYPTSCSDRYTELKHPG